MFRQKIKSVSLCVEDLRLLTVVMRIKIFDIDDFKAFGN
jgi:hypothetical protein